MLLVSPPWVPQSSLLDMYVFFYIEKFITTKPLMLFMAALGIQTNELLRKFPCLFKFQLQPCGVRFTKKSPKQTF